MILIQTLGIHSTARPENGVIGDGGHAVVTESVRGGEGQERRLLIGVQEPLEETALQTRSKSVNIFVSFCFIIGHK